MTPDAVEDARKRLDAVLAQGYGPVNVAIGEVLYRELWKRGLLPYRLFGNVAFPQPLSHPCYGERGWAICDPDIDPEGFLVGKGGE